MFLPGYVSHLVLQVSFAPLRFPPSPLFHVLNLNFDNYYPDIVARIHALSEYTPICASSCGLVLCALQPPHRLCPHCSAPLLTPRERAALLAQLEEERARLLREEAEAREREAEEARLAQGAFPALLGSGITGHSASGGVGGGGGGVAGAGRGARGARGGAGAGGAGGTGLGHRVLLVDSRTKRVKVESYSRPGLELESEDEDVGEVGIVDERVPPPAREVESVRVRRGPATRWVDLKGDETVKYVTPGP